MEVKIYNQKEVLAEGYKLITSAYLRWVMAEDYKKLQAENKLLKEDRDAWKTSESVCNREYNILLAENERHKKALGKYGKHKDDCANYNTCLSCEIIAFDWLVCLNRDIPGKCKRASDCTCGLDKALKETT